jgi:hypothetical protein
MILGLDLERLLQNLKASDLDELVRIAKEMDWDALTYSSEEREDWERMKQSLGEGDLRETISLLKGMDLKELIESSKSPSLDELKERLKSLDLKKAMIVFGLILMARKALTEVGGEVPEGDEGPKTISPEETEVEVEAEAEAKTVEIEAFPQEENEMEEEEGENNFVGSHGSDRYHRPDCGLAERICREIGSGSPASRMQSPWGTDPAPSAAHRMVF